MLASVYRRLLKMGASACLSIAVCLYLQISPFFAIIASLLVWESERENAVRNGWTRLVSACVGAGFALLFFYTLGAHPFVYACITVVTLSICYYMNIGKFRAIASVTAIAILPTMAGAELYEYITRMMSTLVGIILSSVLNIASYLSLSIVGMKKKKRKMPETEAQPFGIHDRR